jgi:hypothetical protein
MEYGIVIGGKDSRLVEIGSGGRWAPFTSSQRPGQAQEGQAEILGGLGISWRC